MMANEEHPRGLLGLDETFLSVEQRKELRADLDAMMNKMFCGEDFVTLNPIFRGVQRSSAVLYAEAAFEKFMLHVARRKGWVSEEQYQQILDGSKSTRAQRKA